MQNAERRPEGGAGDEASDVPDVFVPQGLTAKEALELAALDAAVFRGASEKTLNRKIQIVAKDGSVRPGVGRDVLRGLAKIQGLEHVVQEGVRPKEIVCQNCGKSIPLKKVGSPPRFCRDGCSRRCSTKDCTGEVTVKVAKRRASTGCDAICLKCVCRLAAAGRRARTLEQKKITAEKMRKNYEGLSPKERAERMSKVWAGRRALSPEENARIGRSISKGQARARLLSIADDIADRVVEKMKPPEPAAEWIRPEATPFGKRRALALARSGALKSSKVGRNVLISSASVRDYIALHERNAPEPEEDLFG